MKSKKQSVMFPLNFNSSEAETNRCSCLSSVTIALKFRTSHWTHTKSTQLQHWQIFSAEVQGLCSEQREAPQPVLTRAGSLYQPPLFLFFFFPQAVILHFVPCSLGGILWPFCNDSSTQWQSTCECREVCKESGFTVKHPRRGFSLAACMVVYEGWASSILCSFTWWWQCLWAWGKHQTSAEVCRSSSKLCCSPSNLADFSEELGFQLEKVRTFSVKWVLPSGLWSVHQDSILSSLVESDTSLLFRWFSTLTGAILTFTWFQTYKMGVVAHRPALSCSSIFSYVSSNWRLVQHLGHAAGLIQRTGKFSDPCQLCNSAASVLGKMPLMSKKGGSGGNAPLIWLADLQPSHKHQNKESASCSCRYASSSAHAHCSLASF